MTKHHLDQPDYYPVVYIVISLLALSLGVAVAKYDYRILGFLLAVVIGISIILYPKIGFYLFIISLFLPIRYIDRYFFQIPNIFRWISHLLVLYTATVYLFRYGIVSRKIKKIIPGYMGWSFLLIGILSLISAIYNRSSIIVTILGMRYWIFFIALLIVVRLQLPGFENRIEVLKLLIIVGFIQIPVTIFQRVFFFELDNPDVVAGLFTGYPDLLFLQIFCLMCVIIWYLNNEKLFNLPNGITITLVVLPLVFSNAKAAWVYLPLIVIFIFRKKIFSSIQIIFNFILLIVFVLIGAFAFNALYKSAYGGQHDAIVFLTHPSMVVEYLFPTVPTIENPNRMILKRGEAILFNYDLISEDPVKMVIGLGPGNLSESQIKDGQIYGELKSKVVGMDRNTISATLGELGFFGCLLMIIFFGLMYLKTASSFSSADKKFRELRKAIILWVALLVPYYHVFSSLLLLTVMSLILAPVPQWKALSNTST